MTPFVFARQLFRNATPEWLELFSEESEVRRAEMICKALTVEENIAYSSAWKLEVKGYLELWLNGRGYPHASAKYEIDGLGEF
jgi:hypothetical protein